MIIAGTPATIRTLLLLGAAFTLPCSAVAATYWVAPNGAAVWASCRSASPMAGASACSLATANAGVSPGDTVYLRGGIYNTHIFPRLSGSDAANRITYAAHGTEIPVINNTGTIYATYYHGIALIGRSYIKVSGVTVSMNGGRLMMITNGASYNEIVNCTLDGNGGFSTIQMWDGDSTDVGVQPSVTHNWIHGCTIKNTGKVDATCDDTGGMQLGVPGHDKDSNYNTIENNTFFSGGHHNLETFTKYNVIRGNFFHFEGSMAPPVGGCLFGLDSNGLYGNRNLQIYDGYGEDKFNLIEQNRFGTSGPPPDDDGGDGLTITAARNLIRYNAIYNSQNNGVMFKSGYLSLADNNRFVNNTVYKVGRYRNTAANWQGWGFRWYGSYARAGNVIKNNIFFMHGGTADFGGGSAMIYSDNVVASNSCTEARAGACAVVGDPKFINPDVTDPASATLPNLGLQSSSPAIDAGTNLTQAVGAGGTSRTLVVQDAMYFQDGTWGSDLARGVTFFPDWIAIGTVSNVVQISGVNYATNTITLASPISWADGAKIWLYKKSDGAVVLAGAAPDIGASEFGTNSASPLSGVIPPTGLRTTVH
ncbi:hypothetical protein [Paludibaculum fermentans]|uniref:hypothetical protein n=1 Tax=Paludibaculum fermentans TaxID=1473598 RepID=UPI003EBF7B75